VLSDPKRVTPELENIRDGLLKAVNDGCIAVYFSGIHLSEMAPLDAAVAGAAERRATLLSKLCGLNALISLERVFTLELRSALGLPPAQQSVHSSVGEWYPEGAAEIAPLTNADHRAHVAEAIREAGVNRQLRRAAARRALKHGKVRAPLMSVLAKGARESDLSELLSLYPMREQDARVIGRFAVGDATAAEATAAFESALRDPSWMMQWFSGHHAKLSPFIDWTRKPAESMLVCIENIAAQAVKVRETDARIGTRLSEDLLARGNWEAQQDTMVSRTATRLATVLLGTAQALSHVEVDAHCPGLSVALRSLHSAWWSSTRTTPRRPKLSDFPDALHAAYAPYVDVFRADSAMAPSIERYAKKYGTVVVPKLVALLPELALSEPRTP